MRVGCHVDKHLKFGGRDKTTWAEDGLQHFFNTRQRLAWGPDDKVAETSKAGLACIMLRVSSVRCF